MTLVNLIVQNTVLIFFLIFDWYCQTEYLRFFSRLSSVGTSQFSWPREANWFLCSALIVLSPFSRRFLTFHHKPKRLHSAGKENWSISRLIFYNRLKSRWKFRNLESWLRVEQARPNTSLRLEILQQEKPF